MRDMLSKVCSPQVLGAVKTALVGGAAVVDKIEQQGLPETAGQFCGILVRKMLERSNGFTRS